MKLIDRYTFANGKAFETWYLDADDLAKHGMPECDVIGLRRVVDDEREQMTFMRPDEALILARLLIGAVHQVSEGYRVGPPQMLRVEYGAGEPITISPVVDGDNR